MIAIHKMAELILNSCRKIEAVAELRDMKNLRKITDAWWHQQHRKPGG